MVEKAKKAPFKPLVKTKTQVEIEAEKVIEQILAEESVFKEGLPVEQGGDNGLPWSVRLISVTSLGKTIIALGDDRRLYKRVGDNWVSL